MAEIAKIIGERIRAYRTKAGLSQENLAERAGFHNTYIGQLERGEKNATLESVEKVARALGVSFETLFKHIVDGSTEDVSAKQCYSLMATLPEKEQKLFWNLSRKPLTTRTHSVLHKTSDARAVALASLVLQ